MTSQRKGPRYATPKYLQRPQPELSPSDQKALARLVRKYGRKAVVAATQTVFARGPGRPSKGLLPYHERMHLADWIEEQAEEHRQRGSRKPYTDAEIDLYDLLYSGEEERRDLQKFRKTIKKVRQQGRQYWREVAQKVKKYPKEARQLGQSLPPWL
jgi:hypothetical protein